MASILETGDKQRDRKSAFRILIVEDEFIVANDLRIILERAGYVVVGIAASFEEAEISIAQVAPDIVLLDIMLHGHKTGIDVAAILKTRNIPYIYLTANSNDTVLAAVKESHPQAIILKPFREKDVLVTFEMALYKHAHGVESALRRQQDLQMELLGIFTSARTWEQQLLSATKAFQPHISFDFILIGISNGPDYHKLCGFNRIGTEEYQAIKVSDLPAMTSLPLKEILTALDDETFRPGVVVAEDFPRLSSGQQFTAILAKVFKLESALVYAFKLTQGGQFVMTFYSRSPLGYGAASLLQLKRLEQPLALALDRLLAFDEIEKLSEQLKQENRYLQEEVKTTANFDEIIGKSLPLQKVFDMVRQVSGTDTSVMILGESGTGKELIARSIHNTSARKGKILVKVNCATLPANLIESELFGHEKGAFTGAIDKRIGKFELAHGGSIFLDEIGELPTDLQAKLLRVLQEKEFERLGGKTTLKADVRIIAATNRDLEKEVSEGRFRLDLYYRLNVFPIKLPPLRDRVEDIPLLANFFAKKFCTKIGKPFTNIGQGSMEELLRYDWPGNIRELENVVERAVIIHDGQSTLAWAQPLINRFAVPAATEKYSQPVKTLQEVKQKQHDTEREYLISVLRAANGRIRGRNGASELLGLKPTTLESRMKKLNITKEDIFD
jgi:transcriptional regulator with GAF, ATPase, and Fis domain/AmiR/NasT family two-component response regulator